MNVMIIRLININVQCYRIHNLRSYDVILHICSCGFGILANFDAVLRFLTFFHAVLRFLIPAYAPLLERYSRDFNIRLIDIEEEDGEDCMKVVLDHFRILGFEDASGKLENAKSHSGKAG